MPKALIDNDVMLEKDVTHVASSLATKASGCISNASRPLFLSCVPISDSSAAPDRGIQKAYQTASYPQICLDRRIWLPCKPNPSETSTMLPDKGPAQPLPETILSCRHGISLLPA